MKRRRGRRGVRLRGYSGSASGRTSATANLPWRISRDLLCDGLQQPSGIGDVRIWPVRYRGRPLVRVRLETHGSTWRTG
ncbi:SsgA family sporulation/cell division regulator [Streptomyces sp. NPDC093984]|uniref:SsgA family sporulation/cell division regulator n=1 Tax=Streptomyces sp. NPDC093984 TaxID=3366052 RepID=UPI00381B51B8